MGTISYSVTAVSLLFCAICIAGRLRRMGSTEEASEVPKGLGLYILVICLIAVVSLASVQYGPVIQIIVLAAVAGSGLYLNHASGGQEGKEIWSPRRDGSGAHYPMQIIYIVALTVSMISLMISLAITVSV